MKLLPACLLLVGLLAACKASPEAKAAAAKTYVAQGREEAKRGNFEAALALYDRAIDADPRYADAYVARGYSNVKLRLSTKAEGNARDYEDRALSDYTEAISLDPAQGDAYYNRAMVYSSRAQYRQAAEDLLNAIRLRPQDPEPHLALAQIYEEKFDDMRLKAMEHYEKYADLGGRDPDAREKAKQWKEFKKLTSAAPAPGKPTTEEDEAKARELHARAMALFKEEKKPEALKLIDELLSTYARTRYVQGVLPGLKAIQEAFKKDREPPK